MSCPTADVVSISAVPDVPMIGPGDDLARVIEDAIRADSRGVEDGDVIVVASKLVSKAEGRYVDLSTVEVGPAAAALAAEIGKEPALVELILAESSGVSRSAPGVLIVRHRLGFISANAGIDASNASPREREDGEGPWVLLLPEDPDRSAAFLREAFESTFGVNVGVVITDSHGRPFRLGTVGVAIGSAGIAPLWDYRGSADLDGRVLEVTETALADQIAAAADMVAGQGSEGRGVIRVRGLQFPPGDGKAADLLRAQDRDLYA